MANLSLRRQHLQPSVRIVLLLVAVGGGCREAGEGQLANDREVLVTYDAFREAALNRRWDTAEAIYQKLSTSTLPPPLAQSLPYHAALMAYEKGDWRTSAARCEAALPGDPANPWRRSLYELLGLSYERLGDLQAAARAYENADLPTTRVRLRALRRTLQASHAGEAVK